MGNKIKKACGNCAYAATPLTKDPCRCCFSAGDHPNWVKKGVRNNTFASQDLLQMRVEHLEGELLESLRLNKNLMSALNRLESGMAQLFQEMAKLNSSINRPNGLEPFVTEEEEIRRANHKWTKARTEETLRRYGRYK